MLNIIYIIISYITRVAAAVSAAVNTIFKLAVKAVIKTFPFELEGQKLIIYRPINAAYAVVIRMLKKKISAVAVDGCAVTK